MRGSIPEGRARSYDTERLQQRDKPQAEQQGRRRDTCPFRRSPKPQEFACGGGFVTRLLAPL